MDLKSPLKSSSWEFSFLSTVKNECSVSYIKGDGDVKWRNKWKPVGSLWNGTNKPVAGLHNKSRFVSWYLVSDKLLILAHALLPSTCWVCQYSLMKLVEMNVMRAITVTEQGMGVLISALNSFLIGFFHYFFPCFGRVESHELISNLIDIFPKFGRWTAIRLLWWEVFWKSHKLISIYW